jgi:Na+-transporting NADH:ubiquinone oxidoreductase subunit A
MKTLNQIKSKRNFNVTFKGAPELDVSLVPTAKKNGVSPVNFGFIKAKVIVAVGDSVQRGQALFFDKKNPQVYFHSPVSGTVKAIEYGPQRVLELIEINDATNDNSIKFESLSPMSLTSAQAKSALLERGLWPYLTQLPFNNTPSPEANPPAIIVQLSNPEPFHARLSAVIDEVEPSLLVGLALLSKLTDILVVFADADEAMNLDALTELARVVRVDGDFSLCDPASVVYHLKDRVEYNHSWVCDWQYLVKIGKTLTEGAFYNQQYIAVGGNQLSDNHHYCVTEGALIESIVTKEKLTDRMVFGGLFSGLHTTQSRYLPMGVDAINIIDSDPEVEFMSFLMPGIDKPSYTTAYLSGFLNRFRPTPTSAALNGSERDCVSCGYCESVCPVDSLPQNILRNIKGDDVEEAMRYGLLDCSSCGVCTYVCPSKIDLASLFSDAKKRLYQEVTAE